MKMIWVLSLSLGFSYSGAFGADLSKLDSQEAQAECSRQLVTTQDADYVSNVKAYREQTDKVTPAVHEARTAFLDLIRKNSTANSPGIIVSIGEGFGRDIKFFREQGFRAIGTDGSIAMVEESWKYLGTQDDFHAMIAQDFSLRALGLKPDQKLSGIWAMASLHHVPVHELTSIFIQMRNALAIGGIVHASFIMGVGTPGKAEVAVNRFWSRIDAQTLIALVKEVDGLEIIDKGGRAENDFFVNVPNEGFHFYNLWLKRVQ